MASVRDYAVLYLGGRVSSGGSVIGGGNAVLSTGQHALDGSEHTAATLLDRLLATADHSGLLLPLSGFATDGLRGDGSWGPFAGTGLPWFNVRDYGAVGDGSTDDTAAIDAAIAALNTAGRGVLYFPGGVYKCTAALTTITAGVTILGDGPGVWSWSAGILGAVSTVLLDHATAALFTVTSQFVAMRGLAVRNSHSTAPTAGAALVANGTADYHQQVNVADCLFEGWYDTLDIRVNGQTSIVNGHIYNYVRYGVRIRNTVNTDSGGFTMIGGSILVDPPASGTRGIRIESSGGNKIIGVTIDWAEHCIELAAAASSSILLVQACSFEGYLGDAIHLDANGHSYNQVIVTGNQFNQASNATGHAVYATGVNDIVIDDYHLISDVAAASAFSLNSGSRAYIGRGTNNGFAAIYATSSFTNLLDGTGGVGAGVQISGTPSAGQVPVASSGIAAAWATLAAAPSFATPAIVLGTAAAGGAAATVIRSDSTIVAFDATAPVTQAMGDSAATGAAAIAARRDHKHGMPGLSSATPLVESGSGAVGTALPSSREDHVHPAAAVASAIDHEHVGNIQFNGDGVTTAFELPAAPFDAYSVIASVAGVIQDVVLSGTMLTTMTFASAPASGTNNVRADIVAIAA